MRMGSSSLMRRFLYSSSIFVLFWSNKICSLSIVSNRNIPSAKTFLDAPSRRVTTVALDAAKKLGSSQNDVPFGVQLNEFFKEPVPVAIRKVVDIQQSVEPASKTDFDVVELLTSPPQKPLAIPRPLWLVVLGSIPTGLIWYGYYKFAIEEELLEMELAAGKTPRGFGGYGTLGPFTYGILLGPIAGILHLPGGFNWATAGIVFIYYTQFLLYDRVNELIQEEGKEEPPLTVWWCLPIFFPFNLIVGLRQVHALSQYHYRQRGLKEPPSDPVADFFPFIKADKFTWQTFLTTPSLWCVLLKGVDPIDRTTLPEPIQDFLKIGEE